MQSESQETILLVCFLNERVISFFSFTAHERYQFTARERRNGLHICSQPTCDLRHGAFAATVDRRPHDEARCVVKRVAHLTTLVFYLMEKDVGVDDPQRDHLRIALSQNDK